MNLDDTMLFRHEVATLIGLPQTTVMRLAASDMFPRAVRIGQGGAARFFQSDVLSWLETRGGASKARLNEARRTIKDIVSRRPKRVPKYRQQRQPGRVKVAV